MQLNLYLALYDKEATRTEVELSAGTSILHRLGLGHHAYFWWLDANFSLINLRRQLSLLVENVEPLVLQDVVVLITAARSLNAPRAHMPWERYGSSSKEAAEPRSTDFEGRALAGIVDTLARTYGWTATHILGLPPEVAFAWLQECMLANHKDREWIYSLSEIAWEYNKQTGRSTFRPLRKPSWDYATRALIELSPELVARYYPQGVVINLTERRNVRTAHDRSGATADQTPESPVATPTRVGAN